MLMRDDGDFIQRALELAKKGEGHTRPNPPVGAVIVKNGKIIGEGWHKKAGGDHAEVAAIKNAARKGNSTKDATIYVTLEPCSKSGRVGACTDAIVAAGIKRVIYGSVDPNPVNRGRAKRVLARSGITCECAGDWEGDDLITPFTKHVRTGLPYVTVKLALSLDGKICDDFGNARWISSVESRKMTGRLRETVDAIMVGAETIRRDDPSLLSHGKRNNDLIRVVVTRSGKLPKNAQIFTDGAPNVTRVFRVGRDAGGREPDDPHDPIDAKDLRDVLHQLGKAGVMHVLCEGGLKLARSLADAGLVDEWITVLAPVVIGSRPIARALRGVMEIMNGDGCCSYVQDAFAFVNFRRKYFKE